MPDVTIPGALVLTIGVIFCAARAWVTGDYRTAALAGVVGTVANLLCFYRRLAIQARAERRRSAARRDAEPPTE